MLKPDVYQQAMVVLQPVGYACDQSPLCSGGALGRGQVVWAKSTYDARTHARNAEVFLDGVGVISLDPRWLIRADVLVDVPGLEHAHN